MDIVNLTVPVDYLPTFNPITVEKGKVVIRTNLDMIQFEKLMKENKEKYNMAVKNNPNRFAYIGCVIHSLDRALDEISSAEYNDSVCEFLTEEEVDVLEDAYKDIKKIYYSAQDRLKEFGIKGDSRIDKL